MSQELTRAEATLAGIFSTWFAAGCLALLILTSSGCHSHAPPDPNKDRDLMICQFDFYAGAADGMDAAAFCLDPDPPDLPPELATCYTKGYMHGYLVTVVDNSGCTSVGI